MEVLHIGVEISLLDLKLFKGDGDALSEGLHYSGVDGGLFHWTRPEVESCKVIHNAINNPYLDMFPLRVVMSLMMWALMIVLASRMSICPPAEKPEFHATTIRHL